MPVRTRGHEIEAGSRRRLRDVFENAGWIVWDLHPDYGEDLLVRIFTTREATQYSFFVQAKSTDDIDKYMKGGEKKEKYLSFPIELDHLDNWNKFWEPVILTIWDATNDITYWQIIQDYLQKSGVKASKRKTRNIKVPIENCINHKKGLDHKKILDEIVSRTKRRYRQFERLASGTTALISFIKENTGAEVYYNFEEDIISAEDPFGLIHLIYFDEAFEKLTDIATMLDIAPEQASRLSLIQGLVDKGDASEIKIVPCKNGGVDVFYKDQIILHYSKLNDLKEHAYSRLIEMNEKIGKI